MLMLHQLYASILNSICYCPNIAFVPAVAVSLRFKKEQFGATMQKKIYGWLFLFYFFKLSP